MDEIIDVEPKSLMERMRLKKKTQLSAQQSNPQQLSTQSQKSQQTSSYKPLKMMR